MKFFGFNLTSNTVIKTSQDGIEENLRLSHKISRKMFQITAEEEIELFFYGTEYQQLNVNVIRRRRNEIRIFLRDYMNPFTKEPEYFRSLYS